MGFIKFISDRIRQFFSGKSSPRPEETDASDFENREKIIAFSIALFFALCLWFIVNLSRDFNVTVEVPIQLSNLPEDRTLTSDVPPFARVNLSGEGWKLISVYNNPPGVMINAEAEQVNLNEQIRNQIGAFTDLNIMQVEPAQLRIETERKARKTVPVENRVEISLRDQYGLLADPVFAPDSIEVIGGESQLEEIEYWETEEIHLRDVNRSMETEIPLKPGRSGIFVDPETVTMNLEVAEFTEAEMRIPVRTRNLPSGQAVTYNPSYITVRFDVPIDEYSEIEGSRPFSAYVDYSVLQGDNSGRVTPEVEVADTDYIVRLRSFQPPRVSYFRVISE